MDNSQGKISIINIITMINLNPKIWGPHAWFFIESIAIGLPDTIPIETQNELKHFFISISFLLLSKITSK